VKAFVIDRYDSKKAGRFAEILEPKLKADDVLIKIDAASVNPLDLKIREGKLKFILPYRFPLILGSDLSGVVVAIGSSVQKFKVGDEVYARTDRERTGAFAEFIAIKEAGVAKKPKGVTMEEAAAIPLVGLTAWQVLVERANLKKGQKVLIHAGSGGVGSFAIQLAKHLGAIVATTASTANIDLVKHLGADIVIDYKKENFEMLLQDYDLVLDTLGGEVLEKSFSVLKPGGQAISIAGPPDHHFAEKYKLSFMLKLLMWGLSYQIRRKAQKYQTSYSFLFMESNGYQLAELSSLIETGIIHPVIDQIFSFEEIPAALDYVAMGSAKGKVIIKMG
jgi:NADPH:quinone reductase-like Zn-dependent oxidoreductase